MNEARLASLLPPPETRLRAWNHVSLLAQAGMEMVWAALVLSDGARPDTSQLGPWVRERLANYKVPKGFTLQPALPRNQTG
ncbi:MAG TPA: hypothetical protein PJ988_14370, partial [Anaerolinea sp.]|nr:hypothetical protein [Anaerolinea sp.]